MTDERLAEIERQFREARRIVRLNPPTVRMTTPLERGAALALMEVGQLAWDVIPELMVEVLRLRSRP